MSFMDRKNILSEGFFDRLLKLFKQDKTEYHIMGLVIPRYRWQDWLALVIGVALFVWALVR